MITEALEAQGYVVEEFQDDDRYLSVKWSTDELTTAMVDEFMRAIPIHYSTELKAFFTLLSENEWTHETRFVPMDHGAFIITRLDS
jgi:hypothetical protein